MFSISSFRQFPRDRGANVAVNFALIAPVLLVALGSAVDYAVSSSQKNALQNAADAGALAGARELTLGGADQTHAIHIAKLVARNNLKRDADNVTIEAAVIGNRSSISVDISQGTESFFSGLLSGGASELHVRAVATAASEAQKICVLGLDKSGGPVVGLSNGARLTATECGVYSNSASSAGLASQDSALLKARIICSAGGKIGGSNNFTPEPVTDCPVVTDPLASRPAPSAGPCNAMSVLLKDVVRIMTPGTYCGGLHITGKAKVRFLPGIYVIKNGPFIVNSGADIEGDNVGFFFTGNNTFFRFKEDAKISLGAPKDGIMAGILFFEDRSSVSNVTFEISSSLARKLLGTIYLPRGKLYIAGNSPIADQSAYTAIVARRLELAGSPNLVINSNYTATDVPVPNGIGPANGATRLVR